MKYTQQRTFTLTIFVDHFTVYTNTFTVSLQPYLHLLAATIRGFPFDVDKGSSVDTAPRELKSSLLSLWGKKVINLRSHSASACRDD